MNSGRTIDVLFAGLSLSAWSLAGFLAGSRLLSTAAGVFLALAVPLLSAVLMASKRDQALDLMLNLLGVLAWSVVAFFLVARVVSPAAGGIVALAVGLSALASVVSAHLREGRIASLMQGVCPRCHSAVEPQHQHRRWDPSSVRWLSPDTSWRCSDCGYEHGEAWECPACPEPQ